MALFLTEKLASRFPSGGVEFRGFPPIPILQFKLFPTMNLSSPSEQSPQSNRREAESPPSELFSPLTPNDSTVVAANRMCSADSDWWPVADDGRLVGLVCTRHPDYSTAGYGHDPASVPVREVMSRDLIFCTEDQDRAEVQCLMAEKGLRFLPVVNSAMQIIGFVTRNEANECGIRPVM